MLIDRITLMGLFFVGNHVLYSDK